MQTDWWKKTSELKLTVEVTVPGPETSSVRCSHVKFPESTDFGGHCAGSRMVLKSFGCPLKPTPPAGVAAGPTVIGSGVVALALPAKTDTARTAATGRSQWCRMDELLLCGGANRLAR